MYKELANDFVNKFCNDAVDYTKDMMDDEPQEYSTYEHAKKCIENSIDSFSEGCLDDYLSDFCDMVRKEVAKRKVVVKAVTFDDEGFRGAIQTIEVKE